MPACYALSLNKGCTKRALLPNWQNIGRRGFQQEETTCRSVLFWQKTPFLRRHPNRFHTPAGGTKPPKGTLARIASPPDGKRLATSPRQSGIEPSRRQSAPAPNIRAAKSDAGTLPLRQQPAPRHPAPSAFSRRPTRRHAVNPARVRHPRYQIQCRLVPAPAAARTPAPCPCDVFTTADPPARRQSGPRPTSTLPNPMPARSRSGSSPHPGTLPLRRFHDGRPAGTPSKKTAPPDGGALIISQ